MIRSLSIVALVIGIWLGLAQSACGEDQICGARCAARVLEILEQSGDLTDLIEELYDSPRGGMVSLQDLRRVLRQRGVSCEIYWVALLDLPQSPCPLILHMRGNHFVVLEDSNTWSARIWDGLQGTKTMPWWQLRGQCSGPLLVCAPPDVEPTLRVDPTYRQIVHVSAGAFCLLGIGTAWKRIRRARAQPIASPAPSSA